MLSLFDTFKSGFILETGFFRRIKRRTFLFLTVSHMLKHAAIHDMKSTIKQLQKSGGDIIDCTQAVMGDILPPKSIQKYLKNIVIDDPSLYLLAPVPGCDELRKSIVDWKQEQFSQNISTKNVFITAGANQAMFQILRLLTSPGDEVGLFTPYFLNHFPMIQLVYGKIVEFLLESTSDYQLDDSLYTRFENTSTLIVNEPNNPTSTYFNTTSRDILDQWKTQKPGRYVIIDESYGEFDFRSDHETKVYDLSHEIVIGSFSKSLSLSGFRIGYILAEQGLINQLVHIQDPTIICAPVISQRMAQVGLTKIDHHMSLVLPELKRKQDLLLTYLKRLLLFYDIYANGGPYIWLVLHKGINEGHFLSFLLERKIALLSGSTWGEGVTGLRIPFAHLNDEEIMYICETMREYEFLISYSSRWKKTGGSVL